MTDVESTLTSLRRLSNSQFDLRVESATVENQNFVDLPGDGIDNKSAGDTKYAEEGQHNVLDLNEFLARPVRIYGTTIPLATDTNIRLPVWDLLSLTPSVRAKMRNFSYLKANLKVRISISGSPFHYGRLMVSYQPYAPYNENVIRHTAALAAPTWRPLFLNYLSQAQGAATMNVNENKPLEITCPFISPKPMYRLFNNSAAVLSSVTSYDDMKNAGDLFIYSINQVNAVSATPSPIYLQVYAWFEDVELGTSTATQIDIATESAKDERVAGPIQTLATNAAQISGILSQVPAISVYAKASEFAFKALGRVAAIFGWSKPVFITNPTITKLEPFQNGALMIGTDTNKRIVLDPKQELTVDPSVTGSNEDEMTIKHLASRPSYYNTFTWDDADTPMVTTLHVAKVTPSLGSSVTIAGETFVQPTALAFASAPFLCWRGDITFRFEIVASAFHRGKIAIIYEPNISQQALITANYEFNKQFIRVIDIQETNTFEVTVRWAGYRAWYYVTAANGVGVNQGVLDTVGVGFVNGFISLTPFTQLQSPDGSPVSVNTYVYSNDIYFNNLTSDNLPKRRNIPTVGMMRDLPVESARMYEKPTTGLNTDIMAMDLNKSTATLEHISEDHFGEQPVSFRALLKRYVTNQTLLLGTSGTASRANRLDIRHQILPMNNLPYGSTTNGLPELWSYLQYAFLGMRGGIRKRFHFSAPFFDGLATQVRVSRAPNATASTPVNNVLLDLGAVSTLDGSVMYVPNSFAGFEVEFPFYTNNLFFFSFSTSPIQGSATEEMTSYFSWDYILQYERYGACPASTLIVDLATAEDFSFLRFQGAPFYSYVS